MLIYRQNINWILDKDNNVILVNDDTGISNTESSECDAYAREPDSTELLDYIPYSPFFLLDDKNNVILKDDDTGIILNYGESLSGHDYTAFAVYSDTDNSLIFYYDTQPSVGDTYNRRVVTEIYTGWDTESYDYWEDAPWHPRIPSLKYVSFDRTFANNVYPKSIASWFVNFTDDINLNLDNLDTRYTEDMRNFLNSSSGLTSIDLSSFDTSKVKDMAYVFAGSPDLKTINISSFNTSNVTDMEEMFDGCDSVEVLDLRSFDTTNVTSYKYFATNCDDLQEILISNSFDLFAKSTTALVTQQYWHDSNSNNLNDYLIGVQGNLDCLVGQILHIECAIYSDADNSFVFYTLGKLPEKGEEYNGKIVTNIYTDFLDTEYTETNLPAWYEVCELVKLVSFDESFAHVQPIYTAYWFYGMTNCISIDTKNLDTSQTIDMHDMFSGLESLEELNVNDLDVRNVTSMYGVFYDCSKLTTIDISNWQTDSLTDAHGIFDSCSGLTHIDLSSLNTSKVTDIRRLFYMCKSLQEIDVSTLDTSNVENMNDMFNGCTSLTTIYSDDDMFVTTSVTSGESMFYNDTNLVGGNGTKYSSSNVNYLYAHVDTSSNPGYFTQYVAPAFAVYSTTDDSLTFYGGSDTPATGSTYNGKIVTNVYTDFADKQFTTPPWNSVRSDVKAVYTDSSFKDVTPISTACWFQFFRSCTTMDLTNLNTSRITTMANMFYSNTSLTTITRGIWDTKNVTNMSYVFYNCSSLTELDISDFNTSNVTTMTDMFGMCSSLTNLDLSNFNTIKVTSMSGTFESMYAIKTLDVSNFDTSKVTDMAYMFAGCTGLTTIYSDDSRFVTSAVTTSYDMFTNDTNLVGSNGTKFDSSHNDASYAHVDTSSNPGYFTAK